MVIGKNLFQNHAVGLSRRSSNRGEPSGGQSHFFVPWRDVTLVGTWYWRHEGEDRNADLRGEEIVEMVGDVNGVYPAAELRPEDVVFAHLGFLPLEGEGGSERAAKLLCRHSRVIDYEKERGVAGLIGIEGVKYTTATATAGKAVRLAAKKLKRLLTPLREDPLLFRGGRGDPPKDRPPAALPHLDLLYGGCSRQVAAVIEESPEYVRPLHPSGPTVGGEAVYALRHEMACTLADVVFRRTGLGTAGRPTGEALERCAALMAAELGWDPDRIRREIIAVDETYRSLLPLTLSPAAQR